MKKLSALTICLILAAFVISCSNNKKEINTNFLIGKWKNFNTTNTAIEFTNSGEYIVWTNLKEGDKSEPLKYTYEPSARKFNFKITDESSKNSGLNQGIIDVVDQNRIKITIYINDSTILSSAEFSRM